MKLLNTLQFSITDVLKTTFASHYSHGVSLAGALRKQAITKYGKFAIGAKYLITANKGIAG